MSSPIFAEPAASTTILISADAVASKPLGKMVQVRAAAERGAETSDEYPFPPPDPDDILDDRDSGDGQDSEGHD